MSEIFKFRCTAKLRLRAQPNTKSDIIMLMAKDSIQTAVDEKDGWYQVMTKWNGVPYGGWCCADFCEKIVPEKKESKPVASTVADNSHVAHTHSTHEPKVEIDHKRVLTKEETTAIVWNFLISEGLSEKVASAVMGNIDIESGGFNPKALGARGLFYGLCQWSGDRLNNLKIKARQMGMLQSSLEVQLAHLMDEINGTEATFKMRITNKYGSIEKFKKSDASIEKLTTDFMETFERPSKDPEKNHIARRIESAQKYYNLYAYKSKK